MRSNHQSAESHEAFLGRRLRLPLYQVKDAARLAGITTQTVLNWEKSAEGAAISSRTRGVSLSYLQLVELRFVAVMRNAGMKLEMIRRAREYMKARFGDFPFATRKFESDGVTVYISAEDIIGSAGKEKLIDVGENGQLAWKNIVEGLFLEFEYDADRAVRWHPYQRNQDIIVDPNIAFGAPSIHGVPTWALRGRFNAGELIPSIAQDFVLAAQEVVDALSFEGVVAPNWTLH